MVWFDRGKQKLIEGRHVFNRDKEVKGKLYWKCEDRDFAARIHRVTAETRSGKAKVEYLLSEMKVRVTSTAEPIGP